MAPLKEKIRDLEQRFASGVFCFGFFVVVFVSIEMLKYLLIAQCEGKHNGVISRFKGQCYICLHFLL